MYLGLMLHENLDLNITARTVAQSASRALGLLIAKSKALGGMPYKVFTKLYDTVVWPVISYVATVWGRKVFSCINAVQNRAMRFYLGTGKYTPNAAVSGDMGWQPPQIKQWKAVCAYWYRMTVMSNSRLNKRFFYGLKQRHLSCRNWYFKVREQLTGLGLNIFTTGTFICSKTSFLQQVLEKLEQKHHTEWLNTIQNTTGNRGRGVISLGLTDYLSLIFKLNLTVNCFCLSSTEVLLLNFDVVWPHCASKLGDMRV